MLYNIAETFYSLKGEGLWTGTPMFFIRLAGCNLNCSFCDTDYNVKRQATAHELLDEVHQSGTQRVVITGGEPTLQNTLTLVNLLHKYNYWVHLETNGTIDTHLWDWVTVSPKGPLYTLSPSVMLMANEIKFIVGTENWEDYMIQVLKNFRIKDDCIKWLMPLAKPYPFRLSNGLIEENIKQAVDYCLKHPQFRLCMQLHKTLGIK